LVRALVAVVGRDVPVRRHRYDVARAVAFALLAIAGSLRAGGGSRRGVGGAEGVAVARAQVALGIAPRALRRRVARDARSGGAAERSAVLVAGRVHRLGRVRRDAARAHLARALIAVVRRNVAVRIDLDDVAGAVALIHLAVAAGLRARDRA